MNRIPGTGELYRDLTNHIYQIVAAATDAQTGEKLIVYQALYGDYGVYVRPLAQFAGEGEDGQCLFEKIDKAENQFDREMGGADDQSVGRARESERQFGLKPKQPKRQLGGSLDDSKHQLGGSLNDPKYQLGGSLDDSKYQLGGNLDDSKYQLGGRPNDPKHQLVESLDDPKRQTGGSLNDPKRQTSGNLGDPQRQSDEGMDRSVRQTGDMDKSEWQTADNDNGKQQSSYTRQQMRPRTQSPAESRRALRQNVMDTSAYGQGTYYDERRRRQMEEREQRREMFRKTGRHESATEELRANPCLMKFLEANTYEEKFQVLNEIQNDITDRLIDDIAVVLDVVIPEGELNDRFHQLRNIILTRQKYEISRFR